MRLISDNLSDARMTETTEGEESEAALEEEATQRVHLGTPATGEFHLGTPAAGEYSFRLFPVGEAQERAPFPLPAPFDKRLPGDRRSFAGGQLVQNTGEKSGEQLGEKFGQQTSENLASAAPALPPKKGRREN